MKKVIFLLSLSCLTCCNQTLSIEGFDQVTWKSFLLECTEYRLESADVILSNQKVLLTANQNEIEGLLGPATEHELYERNQKFFHYRLTPPDSCGTYQGLKYLSIRFNAIGKANDVQVVVRE